MHFTHLIRASLALALVMLFLVPGPVRAHCDTMNGPVVTTAKAALEKGDVTPVLKWVKSDDEAEIRALFAQTLKVRSQGPEAKKLADMYFFETLVRLHRAGEGAPYTGLKSEQPEEIIVASDKALEQKSSADLVKQGSEAVLKGIQQRYDRAVETGKHADESVEAGREFVEAYVQFTHYVERLYQDASSSAAHHAENNGGESPHHD